MLSRVLKILVQEYPLLLSLIQKSITSANGEHNECSLYCPFIQSWILVLY